MRVRKDDAMYEIERVSVVYNAGKAHTDYRVVETESGAVVATGLTKQAATTCRDMCNQRGKFNPDLERQLEDGERLLRAALEAVFPGQYEVQRSREVTEDEAPAIEVTGGHAALEPVPTEVPWGLGQALRLRVLWRVYHEVDDSDPSVGMYGTALVPAEPHVAPSRAGWAIYQDCYMDLGDAIRHVVHDLVDMRTAAALENEGITIALERGEL